MIIRISQREQEDCAICAVAMVMGSPYDYERVRADSQKYPKESPDGKFPAWWETYLHDEGFDTCYCHFDGLYALPSYGGNVTALLGMDILLSRRATLSRSMRTELSIPQIRPCIRRTGDYASSRSGYGAGFHSEFLAAKRA